MEALLLWAIITPLMVWRESRMEGFDYGAIKRGMIWPVYLVLGFCVVIVQLAERD